MFSAIKEEERMASRPGYEETRKIGDYDFVMSRRGILRRLTYGVGCALTGGLLLGDCSAAGKAMSFPHDWMLPKDLKVQFFDKFNSFDTKRWTPLLYNSKDNRASVDVENGRLVLRASTSVPEGNAEVGLSTRDRWFNPGLTGCNGVEVHAVSCKHEGKYVGGTHPGFGDYPMGWTLTIGNYEGPVGREGKAPAGIRGRAIQLIFDWWTKYGLNNSICRSIVPGDREKYPEFRDWSPNQPFSVKRDGHRVIDGKDVTFDNMPKPLIDPPCVIPSCKLWPAGVGSHQVVTGRRVGLFLTDDGNKAHWTLDGKVIKSALIPGFASSDHEAFRDGAYVTIYFNGGYQTNVWKYDDIKIYTSA